MVAVRGVLETCLYAENLAETADFYATVLGLATASEVEGRHAFFRCGPAMFLLFHPARTAEGSEVPAHGAVGPGHVAFHVHPEELPAWRARLRDRGVAIEREVTWPGGGASLYLRDPAGNSVELTSPAIWGIEA